MAGTFKYQPYGLINDLYDQLNLDRPKENDYKGSLYKEVDVKSLIKIQNESDIMDKRTKLIQYIWKQNEFPYDKMPSNIENNIVDENYADLQNLKTIDKITTSMENGVDSYAYLFLADTGNNKLVIYHQGHDGGFVLGKKTIQYFLNEGYSVLAFSMPLLGMNTQPVVDLPNLGKLRLETHDDLKFIESDELSPIKFFVEPVALSLNYVGQNHNFDSYYMTGISGGGWTTALYSALDPRIDKSYPVAGSVPTYLRFNSPENMGDYEQMLPSLYSIADYLDLYIMGSYGEEEQLQIFNRYDPCCFSGTGYTTYEDDVKQTVSDLGKGKFGIFLDENNKNHSISDESLDVILQNMKNN